VDGRRSNPASVHINEDLLLEDRPDGVSPKEMEIVDPAISKKGNALNLKDLVEQQRFHSKRTEVSQSSRSSSSQRRRPMMTGLFN
jgi:hypothetical protein